MSDPAPSPDDRPMRSSRTVPFAVAIVAAFASVSCGAAAEKASEKATEQMIESQTGGDVDVDTDGEGKVDIETEDGSLSFGTGELPEDWPEDITVPKGIEILSSTAMDASDGRLTAITATSDRPPAEILEDLKGQLADWTISGETTTTGDAGSVVGAQWETEGRRVNFAASSGGDGQDVSVTLSHTTLS